MMLLLVFRRLITLANPRLFFHPAEQRWGSFSLCIWYYRESLISAAFMLIFKHYPVLLSLEAKKDVLVQIPPAEWQRIPGAYSYLLSGETLISPSGLPAGTVRHGQMSQGNTNWRLYRWDSRLSPQSRFDRLHHHAQLFRAPTAPPSNSTRATFQSDPPSKSKALVPISSMPPALFSPSFLSECNRIRLYPSRATLSHALCFTMLLSAHSLELIVLKRITSSWQMSLHKYH